MNTFSKWGYGPRSHSVSELNWWTMTGCCPTQVMVCSQFTGSTFVCPTEDTTPLPKYFVHILLICNAKYVILLSEGIAVLAPGGTFSIYSTSYCLICLFLLLLFTNIT